MSETVTAKRAIAGQVKERVKREQCLICETQATRRGLCMRHYQNFLRRQREQGAKESQIAFEEACIREGKILAVHQMRVIKRDNPFDV